MQIDTALSWFLEKKLEVSHLYSDLILMHLPCSSKTSDMLFTRLLIMNRNIITLDLDRNWNISKCM